MSKKIVNILADDVLKNLLSCYCRKNGNHIKKNGIFDENAITLKYCRSV